MYKRIPGTKDILPDEANYWQEIENISRGIFSLYGYSEIRPPVVEDVKLFNRSLGEFTEIVQKQMFLIPHQEDTYALRPEGTASIVRAYIENNLDKTVGFVKFYYIGPMFRLERPQKGRLRQFHHIGAEVIGSADPKVDVEVIALADNLLKAYGINGYEIKINTLGCTKDKKLLIQLLSEQLSKKEAALCQECKQRLGHNVLRVLDCKDEGCQKIVKSLDIHNKHLCPECLEHFSKVKSGLDALKIKYDVSTQLVRGLDYYTRTVFEIKHSELGAQDAIGAGGRYDNLVEELGGPNVGAMGFAFGVERLLLVTSHKSQDTSKNLTFVITLGDKAEIEGLKLIFELRNAGIPADTDFESKSLKGALRSASDKNAKFVVIIGENELQKNVVMLKDMDSGEQKEIKISNLVEEIKNV